MKARCLIVLLFIPAVLLPCMGTREKEIPSLQGLTFDLFLEESYEALLKTRPELVTELGLDEKLGMSGRELDPWDEKSLASREKLESKILDLLLQYDPQTLDESQRISRLIYKDYLEDLVSAQQFRRHVYPLSFMLNSVNVSTEQFFTEIIPVKHVEDAEKYIQRLKAVKRKMKEVDRQIELAEEEGIMLPAPLIGPTLDRLRNISRRKAVDCSFYKAFEAALRNLSLDPTVESRLLAEAEKACETSVIPAYRLLEERLERQLSRAPRQTGVGHLPDGEAYYALSLRHHTNSAMGAEEIHRKGLEELQVIHGKMRGLFSALGYEPDESIRTLYRALERDGQRLSGQAIVEEHRALIRKAMNWMKPYFTEFPRSPLEVEEDPFGGFYIPPSLDGSRPGIFYASTGTVGYYTLPTLTFHETWPGHHYQISLAGEMDLPLFRRQAQFTGYLEGWALYAESFMAETGYYDEDIPGLLGYLQAQAFRAARLVVDTGLHLYGWDIDEAVRFFEENTGYNRGFTVNQIYRYLVWPGQAASYYTGYLEFRDLLDREKMRLEEDFDYKTFHFSLVSGGPMPLYILKKEIFHYE